MRNLFFLIFLLGFNPTVYATENISPAEAADLVRQGLAELIDVRERAELEATGMAAPALWLAKSEVDLHSHRYSEFVTLLHPNKKLIFYCRSGSRSGIVADHFETLGFQTMNMGGFDGWVNANLPVRDFPIKDHQPEAVFVVLHFIN